MDVHERLSLDAVSAHTLIAAEHRHRYELAATVAAGRRVLDLCCGVGYGSAILARGGASEVVAVDRDAAAVDAGRAALAREQPGPVAFEVADALTYLRAVPDGAFDLVVCFEGLEHLPQVELVADELGRLVRGGAVLVASVPNSATFEEENDFHLTDFDLPAARALAARIPGVAIAGQTHAEGTLVVPLGHETAKESGGDVAASVEATADGAAPTDGSAASDGPATAKNAVTATVRVPESTEPEWANHFLLVAGIPLEELLGAGDAAMHLAVGPVNHRYMRGLERANRDLQATNMRLARERLGRFGAGAADDATTAEEGSAAAAGPHGDDGTIADRLAFQRERADRLEAELAAATPEHEEHRRAWVVVRHSRLTRIAARVSGHRF